MPVCPVGQLVYPQIVILKPSSFSYMSIVYSKLFQGQAFEDGKNVTGLSWGWG